MSTKANSTGGTRISHQDLKVAVKKINDYFDSLNKIYVGREKIIELVKYAMLQKSHAIFFGHPGTSKTAIADSMLSGITSATKFEVQLTAFMAEDGIFGPYNIKKMRDEGILEHNVEHMLPQADFAIFDEILDASSQVLRSLLSSMNERRMVKGRQVLDLPLHLAYCATNIDPYVYLKRNPQAWAVFDRISFIGQVDYLDKAEDISEMIKRFQYRTSRVPSKTLDLSVINSVCDYILFPPTIIQDQIIFIKFAEAVIEYRKLRKEKMKELEESGDVVNYQGMIFSDISDRRVCWASQMLEVNAVLAGRIHVVPEDMIAAHFVLCTSPIEEKIWKEIISQKVLEIHELKKNELSDLQLKNLGHLKDQFEEIVSEGDLETRINGIATLILQMQAIKPENETVDNLFTALKTRVDEYQVKVGEELLSSKGLGSKISNGIQTHA
jgi:MoxR-like ATPase